MSGPECCSNPPKLNPSSGLGHVENLAGFNAYVTSSSSESKLAVLLASDIFGYEVANLRTLSDKIAAAGFFVVVPDFFDNDRYDPEDASRPMSVWVSDHRDKGFEDVKVIIEVLKSKGFSSIGAAGFCWGAKPVVELAKIKSIDVAVILHPSFVTVEDIKKVKVPIVVLGAEIDHTCPPKLARQFEEILNERPEIESFVKVFPGVIHGWTTRYNPEDEKALKSAEESHADLIDWFSKYVK